MGLWLRGLLVVLLATTVGCGDDTPPRAGGSAPPATVARVSEPPEDPCAEYPPPFEASYLPDGFDPKLRRGAGLFKGADGAGSDYPTEGLLGYYRGPVEVLHVNFQIRNGPLPYVPANPHPLRVLGRPGAIGTIEGGWSVEFSLGRCDFRMDTYGIDRRETVKVARGLRRRG